jgi:signal peptidase I
MLPTIQDGDILHIEPVITRGPAVGQIVLLRKGEEFRAHRVIRKQGDSFVTRGDSGVEDDGEIPRGQILGLVVAKQCSVTGRMVRFDTFAARLGFLLRECRRRTAQFRGSFTRN